MKARGGSEIFEKNKSRGGEEDEITSQKEEQDYLEVLTIENHRFYFDITHILSVVLDYLKTKHGIML